MLWLWKRGTPETAIPVGSLEEYYRRDPAVYVFPGVTDKLEVQRELLSACNNMAATILQASSVSDDAYEINKLCDVLIVSCAYMMTGCKPEDLKWKDIYHFCERICPRLSTPCWRLTPAQTLYFMVLSIGLQIWFPKTFAVILSLPPFGECTVTFTGSSCSGRFKNTVIDPHCGFVRIP